MRRERSRGMKKKNAVKNRRSFTLAERFRYWFDNRIAGGSLGLIRWLIAVAVVLALFIAG